MSKSLARPFKCSVCERPFTRQENLKRHVQTHHPSAVSRSYPCPQCDARFSRSDLRKRHVRNCHPSTDMMLPTVPWQSIEDEFCFPSIQDHSIDDQDLFLGPSLPVKKPSPESQYCEAFFEKFHPTMPTLHQPTFDSAKGPKSLITAAACIGALYSNTDSRFSTSRKLFEDGYRSLEEYTREDRSRFQETWVLQAYILLEVCGIYVCDDALLSKAQSIHSALVSAIRELQITHDGHTSRLETPNSPELTPITADDDPSTLQTRWLAFIQEEARKRCIYSIYLLDAQLAIACNLRPLISALEIKYALPCADDAWAAASATSWSTTQTHHFRSFNERDDAFATPEASPSRGLFCATALDLLSSTTTAPPPPLGLLWTSPFAALILVTQLQMTARELTHATCLLARPSRSSQRPLSILSEAQHGQLAHALQSIAELVPPSPAHPAPADDNPFAPLWHAFWLTWRYTAITLSHADALLVSGIVETNLPAAIATAAHLARPRRREHRDLYEDRDVFRILAHLDDSLRRIGKAGSSENPFQTLLAFKICLVGWRLVRLTMGDEGGGPARFVLGSIMEAVEGGRGREAEVEYLAWVREQLGRRGVWPVGRWEAAIVEEAVGEAVGWVGMVRDGEGGL